MDYNDKQRALDRTWTINMTLTDVSMTDSLLLYNRLPPEEEKFTSWVEILSSNYMERPVCPVR
jgi:hypothetical protein